MLYLCKSKNTRRLSYEIQKFNRCYCSIQQYGFAGGDIGGVTDFQNTDYIEAEREANNIIEEANQTTVEDFTTYYDNS